VTDTADKLSKLKDYHALAKQVMGVADKQTIEEVARVLATRIGFYERRYGVIPMEDTIASLHAENPGEEQIADLAQGMQTLVSVMLLATGVMGDEAGEA